MKKILSLILAVLMIFSVTAVGAFAADETQKPVKVTFIYDDANSRGQAIEKTKVIYVDFGENYNSQVPTGVYYKTTDGVRYKFYTKLWKADLAGYSANLYEKGNFPVFDAADEGVLTEITFTAQMGVEEVSAENIAGDIAEGALGKDTVNLLTEFIETLKLWFGQLILYLANLFV
jgi:hypothetical protein